MYTSTHETGETKIEDAKYAQEALGINL